jgi:uncharacterized protein Yka (UPF0111/DUF47 family)
VGSETGVVALMKSTIIEELGEGELLLPARIAAGLAANDRVKVRLSILQAAAQHACNPNGTHFDLAAECGATGIVPGAMQALVNRANLSSSERITAPGLSALIAAIWDDVMEMAGAVQAGDPTASDRALERLTALKAAAAIDNADDIALAQISRLTAVSDGDLDSLHRLIMDLHKTLNRLAATCAEEVIAGAHAFGLLPEDRAAVTAFMRGVTATAKLKFGHPGLATTAARSGSRLTIQNDIGETDAHVIVITVERNAVTVTYSDVHHARAKFFTGLFKGFAVQWSGLEGKSVAGLAEGGVFYLVTGHYPADNGDSRDAFLEALGASLVFLIDWNKARKVLRTLVPKNDAVDILDWAARHRFGHRGFLEAGGSKFLGAAVRHAAPNRIGFGEQLDEVLGRAAAIDFLKSAIRIAAETLLQGGALRQARDHVEADFVRHLQRIDGALLNVVMCQAGLARELAADLAYCLAERGKQRPFDCASLTKNARHIEEKADRIAMDARNEINRLGADRNIEHLVNRMEDSIDELEQAAFVASLLPTELAAELIAPLVELSEIVVRATEAAANGTAAAAEVPDGHQIDSEDALAAMDRLLDAEHQADAAERKVTANVMVGAFDVKTAFSVIELARTLERATDRLAAFGHALREHVLADLSTS